MSQKLTLPLNDVYITAGYKSAAYRSYWKFHHFGCDCVSAKSRNVLSLGFGTVLACGLDGATPALRLGNVLVIRYDDVLFNDGKTRSLVCRMYHLDSIAVKQGDTVTRGQVIAQYGNTGYHTTGAHLHIEFDTDVQYPCYAYGVSSGGKIILAGTVDSSVDPDKVWFAGDGQSLQGASSSSWYTSDQANAPRLPEDSDAKALSDALELAAQWEGKYIDLRDALRKLVN